MTVKFEIHSAECERSLCDHCKCTTEKEEPCHGSQMVAVPTGWLEELQAAAWECLGEDCVTTKKKNWKRVLDRLETALQLFRSEKP